MKLALRQISLGYNFQHKMNNDFEKTQSAHSRRNTLLYV